MIENLKYDTIFNLLTVAIKMGVIIVKLLFQITDQDKSVLL